jgi:uncharacterized membrane protein YccF (DUF307 family)
MDLVAVLILVCVGLFSIIMFNEDGICSTSGWIFVGIIIFFNLFWFPIVFSAYNTETKTFITNQYREMQFSEPVEITETRKYKKMSAFFDNTEIKIKVMP